MSDNSRYELVAQCLRWLAAHQAEQPDLGRLATEVGVSPYHLQRIFQAWAGVSPKQFLKALTRDAALERLVAGLPVLESAIGSGLSGPGRLHDLVVSTDALTPGEIRSRGRSVDIRYGFGHSLFGEALVAWTRRGITFLGFCEDAGTRRSLDSLMHQYPEAQFVEDRPGAKSWLERVFRDVGRQPPRLWLRGSPFQLRVWTALLSIPPGAHASYGQIAAAIGQPGATRAVGNAVGRNPVAWLIPCHRVIRQIGELGGYRWGPVTKQAMVAYEATRCEARNEAR